jgi:predicted DCC family thiol-disulfide oxidoreductase YuxK
MVFDGVCNFCSTAVRLVAFMDGRGVIRFAATQSSYGRGLCERAEVDPGDPTTFLFFDHGMPLQASDAIVALLARLMPPWRWLRVLVVVPRPLRDAVYRLLARNRYRLFGKRTTCMIPSAELQSRFVEDPPI